MSAHTIGAFEAKTRLSELLEQVSQGHTFVITRRGRPVAELRPAGVGSARMQFGSDKGRIAIAADFDAPLPDLDAYEQ